MSPSMSLLDLGAQTTLMAGVPMPPVVMPMTFLFFFVFFLHHDFYLILVAILFLFFVFATTWR